MWTEYDHGDADDDSVSSVISTSPDLDTATSPSEYGHDDDPDDFEQFSLDGDGIGDGDGVNSEMSCGCSTSVTPSAYEDEVAHGRRYHGFRKGRYPLPNDDLEQRREETNHALMLELTVCYNDRPTCDPRHASLGAPVVDSYDLRCFLGKTLTRCFRG